MAHKSCVATAGSEYLMENKPWVVTFVGDDLVKLRCISRGFQEEFTYFDFNAAVFEGDIKVPKLAKDGIPLPDIKFADLSSDIRSVVYRCNAYVRKYSVDKHRRSTTKDEIINLVAQKISDMKPPSLRTVQRWHKKWLQMDCNWIAFLDPKYWNSADIRMDHCRNALLMEIIEECYLVYKSNYSYRDVIAEFDGRIGLPEYEHLGNELPSPATIGRRLENNYGKVEVVRRREGEEAARRLLESMGEPERASRINQVWEIDETIVDCFVVNEYGVPIGRPTLVLVVDVFTNMIMGVCITFRSPSTAVIMHAIKMAILPKDKVLQDVDDIAGEWPCFGIPESLRTDNINHYWSDALSHALQDLKVEQEHSKVRKPKGKATVERKFLTINITHLNRIPGYVEKISARIQETGLDPVKNAIVNLDEFKGHMYRWIVNDNNYRPETRLKGRRAVDAWNDNAEFYTPRMDRTLDSLDTSLMSGVAERSIQSGKGIAFKNTQYTSTELMRLHTKISNKKKFKKGWKNPTVKFRWDDQDLGYIRVLNPITNEYFQVWTNNEAYHGLSEPLYKCSLEMKEQVKKQDGKNIEVSEAVRLTKKAFVEMTGGKQKIAYRKRVAATQERLKQKELDRPQVEKGDDFADRINNKAELGVDSMNNRSDDAEFGPSSCVED